MTIVCNGDDTKDCDADNGNPCPQCQATYDYYEWLYGHGDRELLRQQDPRHPDAKSDDEVEAEREALKDAGRWP